MLHWEIAKLERFEVVLQWWDHKPLPSICDNFEKLLWDFTIVTDRHLYVSSRKHVHLIHIAIPDDERIEASKF